MARSDWSRSGPSPATVLPISMSPAYQNSSAPARTPSEKRRTMSDIPSLEALLGARGPTQAWFDASIRELGPFTEPTFDDERFLAVFSSAGRSLGKASVALTEAEAARLRAGGISWPIDGWCVDELGRVLLLGRAFRDLPAA